ncbi:unnamed protein product [Polarella glacialis]|uniref:Uncharacterized protein n=1 Tax=Polarella glacialis TaxID=89957 RepID=A0A813EY07_POLGL|nr:unnamed protein product [Polarella glacialis]
MSGRALLFVLLLLGVLTSAATAADTSCDDEMQKELLDAQDLGAQYLAKKRREVRVLKKPPSLIQTGMKTSFKLSRTTGAQAVLSPEEKTPQSRDPPSFNPFKPDASLAAPEDHE